MSVMGFVDRVARHTRLSAKAFESRPHPSFLVLFINSICNMKCEHCFYWTALNKKDDLSFEEICALSDDIGPLEILYLSGGEPFLRKEFAEVAHKFITTNGVKEIYVPSNGFFTDRCVAAVRKTLENKDLKLFAIELSLDGMPEFHDKFRVTRHAFEHALQTYEALAAIQREDPRLRIHAISTATDVNMDEIRQLSTYLFDRCPQIDHHNLGIIRGDRKNKSLTGPKLAEYEELFEYVRRLWSPRESERFGSVVEPMLQWGKLETLKQETQLIPCLAGKLSGVVYANGDVGVCEIHDPIGNLRQQKFSEIWSSPKAVALRESIARKECYCTYEIAMWPSIVFQPVQLMRAAVASNAWRQPVPLAPSERAAVPTVTFPTRQSDVDESAAVPAAT